MKLTGDDYYDAWKLWMPESFKQTIPTDFASPELSIFWHGTMESWEGDEERFQGEFPEFVAELEKKKLRMALAGEPWRRR